MPGTGRPSASFSSDGGRLFAREVERAQEQHEGTASEQRRRTELESARRTSRRAGFGTERPEAPREAERAEESDVLPVETPLGATRAFEPAPQAPEPAAAPQAKVGVPSSSAASSANLVAEAPAAVPAQAPTTSMPAVALAANTAPALERASAAAAAPATESPALPPASLRATGAKPAAAAAEAAPESGANPAARAEEIVRQIELHLAPGVKRLTLELAPAELGRLSIQLALRAGKIAAIVRGERPESLALLASRADELQRLFAERGIAADEVRFELGFRAPVAARRSARSFHAPTTVPGPAGRAGPDSVDTYA